MRIKSGASMLLGFALSWVMACPCIGQMHPGDRRKAYGEVRALVMESLLTTLYPGAQVQWDPDLMVRMPGGDPRPVQVSLYVRGSANGGLEGVAAIEWQREKETFIHEAQNFQRSDTPNFLTQLIVFRADTGGHVNSYKKLDLDPLDQLTELKTFSIEDWSQNNWPTLHVQYDSHMVAPSVFTTIEWQGTFDANTGRFVNRLPFGISRKVKSGPEEGYMFSVARVGPTTLQIMDQLTKKAVQYHCSEPCVVDGPTLLSQWPQ